MCGIAGIANLASAPAPDRGLLQRMIEALRHRGPDGFGYYTDSDVGLAHARLSIIDIASGQQPIHNEDRSVWVVLNGEIFNYIELRRELEAIGHRFYTQSDTEVLVHAYEQYGVRFLDQLNGQFALALWDARRKRLILARDRVGIRPLFYTRLGNRLLFASEIKSLLRHPSVRRELDPIAMGEVFSYWAAVPPKTVFAGIESLPPAHYLTIQGGALSSHRYWDWTFPTHPIAATATDDDLVEQARFLLTDAVRLQRRADVPVGAYLSGGLDSAVIAALVQRTSTAPLRTFSITFDDAEFDESMYQRQMVDHLRTAHSEFQCTHAAIRDHFPLAVWHAETPLIRVSPVPLLLLSQRVRSAGYKVVLTGEGADEVFGGYDLFKEARVRRFWARCPQSRWRSALLGRLYPYLKYSPSSALAYRDQFFRQGIDRLDCPYFGHIPRWALTRRIWKFFSPELRDALGDLERYDAIETQIPSESHRWSALARDQYFEVQTLMSGFLLSSQGDRMAMANSIEGRYPYLDHRVIEFANRLPPRLKLNGLKEKYLLKQSAREWIPAEIRQRPKQPYRAPDVRSFFHCGRTADYVEVLFSKSRLSDVGWFDVPTVRALYVKCSDGRAIGFADSMAFVGILSALLLDALFIRSESIQGQAAVG